MTADTLLDLGRAWLAAGAVTATAFIPIGAGRVEPGAVDAWPFRLLLIPGVLLIWPLVLWRWALVERGRPAAVQRPPLRAQDRLGIALALAIPAILTLGVAVRQVGSVERVAVQIEAPAEAE